MAELTEPAPFVQSAPVEVVAVKSSDAATTRGADRIRAAVRAHYGALWRWLRRLGIPEAQVEDAAQQTLFVFARRIDDVELDREKTFLFGVALRVAQSVRRENRRWCEAGDDGLIAELPAPGPGAEQERDDRRARALLDAILGAMPLDLRAVFVLHEVEEMTMAEIARTLGVAPGTVASRLRRAREAFEVLSRRAQAHAASRARGRLR